MFKSKPSKILAVLSILGIFLSTANAGLLGDLGDLLSGSPEKLTQKALERVQREAAYKVLESGLYNAGVNGARHFVDAIRALVEDENWGKATAAFYAGLDKSGSEEARDVLKTIYTIALTVRLTNKHVSNELIGLIEYVNLNYHF